MSKKFSRPHKEKYGCDYVDTDTDSSYSSSLSSFIYLDRKNSGRNEALETQSALRKASVLKKFILEDMRNRIDRETLTREDSTSSIVHLKTEENMEKAMSDVLTNLLTLRVKQEKEKDLQISMWKMQTEDFGSMNWNEFINNHHHIVIDRSSKYTFIGTSKVVSVY